MHRRATVTTLGAIALLSLTFVAPRPVAAQAAMHCPAGQSPGFALGIGQLHERLGPTMGVPLECEYVNSANGDTVQHTTTGLAYYRPEINTPMFTDGQTHWVLSGTQVLMWRNGSVVPPHRPHRSCRLWPTLYS